MRRCDDVRLTNLPGQPAQIEQTVAHGRRRNLFGMPGIDQKADVVGVEIDSPLAAHAKSEPLLGTQQQGALAVCLRCLRSLRIAPANLADVMFQLMQARAFAFFLRRTYGRGRRSRSQPFEYGSPDVSIRMLVIHHSLHSQERKQSMHGKYGYGGGTVV